MRQTILPSDPPARFWRPRGVRLPTQPVPFQPGVVFVSAARRSIIGPQHIESVPDLVVETHSPSNWPDDRQERFRVYQTAGVPGYWIVDYRVRTVEAFVLEAGEYPLLGKCALGATVSSRFSPVSRSPWPMSDAISGRAMREQHLPIGPPLTVGP